MRNNSAGTVAAIVETHYLPRRIVTPAERRSGPVDEPPSSARPSSEREQRGLPPGARGLRLGSEPRHSIVLASTQPREVLERRLSPLVRDCEALGVELVVARATQPEELAALAARFPYALFMPAPDGSTVRQLRAIGITAADGDVVTMLEDDCDVPEGWVAALRGRTGTTDA